MMVMAFLNRTNLMLKPKNLRAIFTQHTCRRRRIGKRGMTIALFSRDRHLLATIQRQNLGPVSTRATVRRRVLSRLLDDTLGKSLKHLRVVAQIARLYKGNARIFRRHLIGEPVNTVDQNA